MPELKKSQTHENLKRLFAREAEAKERYLYFARIAEFEGQPEIAKLFQEMAEAQSVLVDGHLDFLRTVEDPLSGLPLGDTDANLAATRASEGEDGEHLYPEVARTAQAEGFPAIASWFESLARTKKAHLRRIADMRALPKKAAS